jgi:hypothetical protein
MDDLDKRIEQTLASLDGIERAEAPDDLYDRTLERLARQQPLTVQLVPMRYVLQAAAVFVGILIVNIACLFFLKPSPHTVQVTPSGREEGQIATYSDFNSARQAMASLYFEDKSLKF